MSASEQRLYFLLQTTAHLFKKKADATCVEAAGLTTAQAAVLSIINGQGPVSQNRVAAQLSPRESAMTKMTARLEKAGYISKTKSKEDARAWALESTKLGRDVLLKIKAPFKEINAVFDQTLDESETTRLANDLKRLLNSLNNEDAWPSDKDK